MRAAARSHPDVSSHPSQTTAGHRPVPARRRGFGQTVAMNRLAIHESVAADLEPTELITLAQQSGFDSVGLKVAHGPGAERW